MTNTSVTIDLAALADIYHDAGMCECFRKQAEADKAKMEEAKRERLEALTELDKQNKAVEELLKSERAERKPRELSPLFKQRLANTAEVLDTLQPVPLPDDGEMPTVNADRFNSIRKALHELHHVVLKEVVA